MKRLACLLGKHSWTTLVEHGEEFSVCSVCGKERPGGSGGGGNAMREHVWDRVGGGGQ
jgi:hypothetical protein